MKRFYILLLLVMVLTGCGGGLSNEQRKAFQQEMKSREIRKVNEEDIVAETHALGQRLYQDYLQQRDTLLNRIEARTYLLRKGDQVSNRIEQELLDAYGYSSVENLGENVQRDGEDMIYTVPIVMNDSLDALRVFRIPRRQIILILQ